MSAVTVINRTTSRSDLTWLEEIFGDSGIMTGIHSTRRALRNPAPIFWREVGNPRGADDNMSRLVFERVLMNEAILSRTGITFPVDEVRPADKAKSECRVQDQQLGDAEACTRRK